MLSLLRSVFENMYTKCCFLLLVREISNTRLLIACHKMNFELFCSTNGERNATAIIKTFLKW